MGSQGYTKFRNTTEIPLFSLILIYYVEVQEEENFVTAILFVLRSTQWGHVERGQFTYPHAYWAGLVL